ncbi:diguanylate cyclase domain-containing protein, partial [Corynebacterium pseudokroppenstedtii]
MNTTIISKTSLGVSVYPDDGEKFDSLITKADQAMYTAK